MMTTMNKLAELGVTIDCALPMECYSVADYVAMDKEQLSKIYRELGNKMDCRIATDEEEALYWEISAYYDDEYYYENIDAFLEYQSRMNEPDFDWDFYSDWHKDMYGYRPH